eukprot:361894-Chlamydomonas_euryale.AAC.7
MRALPRRAPAAPCGGTCSTRHCRRAYLYLAMNLTWNFDSDRMAASMSSSDGRNVVRKWLVPSSWPNPLPGTTTMPVSTSRSWQ